MQPQHPTSPPITLDFWFQPNPQHTGLACSFKLSRLRYLKQLLGLSSVTRLHQPHYYLGWGLKKSGQRALNRKKHANALLLEDGFIRSVGLGATDIHPWSIVCDDMGIYYDASQPSRLEQLINQTHHHTDTDRFKRCHTLINTINEHCIAKYNHAPLWQHPTNTNTSEHILVIDQTKGDASIQGAGATEQSFMTMLEVAKQQHPHATIWIKTHPDVVGKKSKGFFDLLTDHQNIRLIRNDINGPSLIKQMSVVYTVCSQMGFEALLQQKTVHTFGMPWYAGWGLTIDHHPQINQLAKRRNQHKTLTELFDAAYLQYTSYVHPATGTPINLEQLLPIVIQNSQWNRALAGTLVCYGVSLRKHWIFAQIFQFPSVKRIHLLGKYAPSRALAYASKPQHHLLLWGSAYPELASAFKEKGGTVWRIEDGFIRSVGLGAKLVRPMSLCLDDLGMYYDPSTPSRIETLLTQAQPTQNQQQQAKTLVRTLNELQLNKYNLNASPLCIDTPKDQKVILVTGQVENDASILKGAEIRSNLTLLQTVRQYEPDAFIIYKPHPDVETGLRVGAIDECTAKQYANIVAKDININSCLAVANEVHVNTSLTGFEALIRGKKVVCYGKPFYAGYGLTVDRLNDVSWKRGSINLDTLVYVTLIQYPIYMLPNHKGLVDIDTVIAQIITQRQANELAP